MGTPGLDDLVPVTDCSRANTLSSTSMAGSSFVNTLFSAPHNTASYSPLLHRLGYMCHYPFFGSVNAYNVKGFGVDFLCV